MRVRIDSYTQKNFKRVTIKVFKPIVKREEKKNYPEDDFCRSLEIKKVEGPKKHIVYHIQSGCVSTTSSLPLSIDEKSSIINTRVVSERYFIGHVIIKV